MDRKYVIEKGSGCWHISVWLLAGRSYSGAIWHRYAIDRSWPTWQAADGWIRAGGLEPVEVVDNGSPLAAAA